MSSRNEYAAATRIADHIRRCLSCITRQPSQLTTQVPNTSRFLLSFLPAREHTALESNSSGARIFLAVQFDLRSYLHESEHSGFDAEIAGYNISISLSNNQELLSYHWHPNGIGHFRGPHLHVSARAGVSDEHSHSIHLGKKHLTTGLVQIEEIVRMLIQDFEVRPLVQDWERRLRLSK